MGKCNSNKIIFCATLIIILCNLVYAQSDVWPKKYKAAISFTFDDARDSQATVALPFLKKNGVKATFYLQTNQAGRRLKEWKEAAKSGQEIGSHSHTHPCSKNFEWTRENALEDYTLKAMRDDLNKSVTWIKENIGVQPKSFAYPCGETFVGRGAGTQSYVPLVAELFQSGRAAYNEAHNDPMYSDFSQLFSLNLDQVTIDQVRPLIEQAIKSNGWIVFMAHDVGSISSKAKQTAYLETMQAIIDLAKNSENPIWIAPVGTVRDHLNNIRGKSDQGGSPSESGEPPTTK